MEQLVAPGQGEIVGKLAILAEARQDPPGHWGYLEKPPVFDADGAAQG